MSIIRDYIKQIGARYQRAWDYYIPEELVPKNVYMCWTHHNMMASVLLKNKYRSNTFGPVDSGSIYIHGKTTGRAVADAISNLKDDEILLIGTSDTSSFYIGGGEKLYPMTYYGVVKIEHDEDGFDLCRHKDSPMFHIAQSTGNLDKVYYGTNHDTTFFIGGEYVYTGQEPNHFALHTIKTSDKVSAAGRPAYMEYQFGTEKYAGRFAFYQAKFVKEGKDVTNTVQQYLEDSGDDFDSSTYEFFWNML